ncbi:hypothetical protein QUF80_06615 [Desulfococcaceae bacterium HSG8]|nr:hypothetical protein [Desulfococcaceae bacterium HSG8]
MESITVATIIDAETYSNLEFLAGNTSSSPSELATEAIRIYIEDQSWQIEAIKEGIKQAEAGNFASENKVRSVFSKWGVNV